MAIENAEARERRLIEAAHALLLGADERTLLTTNLNKALFYLDLCALRDLGRPISEATFIALSQGPVVAKYEKRLIGALQESGVAVQTKKGNALPVTLIAAEAPLQYLPAGSHERELAEKLGAYFSGKTATEASDLSHENAGWIMAFKGEGMPPQPINMAIAMQQIAGKDPWLEEPIELTADEIKALDEGQGVPW